MRPESLDPEAEVLLPMDFRYCGTPEEAARPVEEVLDYVPGECWPQLLNSPSAAILVGELLKKEVLGLPRPLYAQVRDQLENPPCNPQ